MGRMLRHRRLLLYVEPIRYSRAVIQLEIMVGE